MRTTWNIVYARYDAAAIPLIFILRSQECIFWLVLHHSCVSSRAYNFPIIIIMKHILYVLGTIARVPSKCSYMIICGVCVRCTCARVYVCCVQTTIVYYKIQIFMSEDGNGGDGIDNGDNEGGCEPDVLKANERMNNNNNYNTFVEKFVSIMACMSKRYRIVFAHIYGAELPLIYSNGRIGSRSHLFY